MKSIEYDKSFTEQPFFNLTRQMLDDVRDHNFEDLASICDDDFGIIDINTEGGSEVIRNRKEWEGWFTGLFKQLKEINAKTWSEITRYESLRMTDMGYSVVDFDQILIAFGKTMRFSVIATIIWKKQNGAWKESRYHSSLLNVTEEKSTA
jgi:hypothetical protein